MEHSLHIRAIASLTLCRSQLDTFFPHHSILNKLYLGLQLGVCRLGSFTHDDIYVTIKLLALIVDPIEGKERNRSLR